MSVTPLQQIKKTWAEIIEVDTKRDPVGWAEFLGRRAPAAMKVEALEHIRANLRRPVSEQGDRGGIALRLINKESI